MSQRVQARYYILPLDFQSRETECTASVCGNKGFWYCASWDCWRCVLVWPFASCGPGDSFFNSHSVPACPFTSRIVMCLHILLINVRDLGHQWIIGVGVRQQRADGQEHLRYGERGWPLVLQDVQADWAITVDVHVVHFCGEGHLGRLEGVVGREMDVQEENTLMVRWVFRSHDSCLPVELVRLVGRASRAVRGRVSTKVDKLLLDSFKCHN